MIKIHDNIVLEISKDGLNAYIDITKNKDKPIEYNPHKVISEIEKYIKFGLEKETLMNININHIPPNKICIARGKLPVDGKDGRIKYHFKPVIKLIPKLGDDGTVDYRELNSINNISKDHILAEIIPPVKGTNGVKVTGEDIPFTKGKETKFNKSKNTYISDDGLYLKSEVDGIIEYKNNKVGVSKILVVDNVDNSVGNICFSGNVTVNKDLLNGYKIEASGAVEIKGSLEGGYIKSKDDVLIRRGVQGFNKLAVETKGNLATKYIENSIINVEGNITAEAIMHSDTSSKSNILLIGKRGLIVGGICRANHEIRAKIIGSSMATKTIVEVGIDPDIKSRFKEVEYEFQSNKDKLKKINQSLAVLEKLKKSNKLDKNKEKLYNDLIKAENTLSLKNRILEKEYINLNNKMEGLSTGKIKVADTIYPGVKIVIGKSYIFIREEMKRCTFFNEKNEIRIGPY